MNAEKLYNVPDVSYLDHMVLQLNGKIKLLSAEFWRRLDPLHLRLWCHKTARYNIPTKELVSWLKEKIAGRSAIEIGSGNGDLGYHLGIPETDNCCQQFPGVKTYYQTLRQIPTDPEQNGVEKIDAIEAIKKYKPEIVIGAWITHKYAGGSQGNVYGPKEEDIIEKVKAYIHVGNEIVHGQKTILVLPHEVFKPSWLVSRASQPGKNFIQVWNC